MKLLPVFAVAFCLLSFSFARQSNDPISGTWKGTSLCQVKNSPCHDEIAIYHASKIDGKTYKFQMNKMVDGKEEEMGPLNFTYDAAAKTLTGENTGRGGMKSLWKFRLEGKSIHGTLTLGDGTLYRIIEIQKTD